MDDIGGVILVALVITLIVIAVAVGVAVIVVVAALAGIGFLVYRIAKAVALHLDELAEEQERMRLATLEQQRVLALQAEEEGRRQEIRRQVLEAEHQRQQQERERLEQERMRQAQEELARQQLESERDKARESLAQWDSGLFVKRPSAEQIGQVVEEASRMQSHCGKYLHVLVLMCPAGIALEWKAHTGTGCVPQVIGMRGNEEMFSEWAFAGRHTAHLSPGRHELAFRVNRGGQSGNEIDLAFEVFVPVETSPHPGEHFKKAVEATAKEFVSRAKTVATAKRKVIETLTSEGNDPDEVVVEVARFESKVNEIAGEQ